MPKIVDHDQYRKELLSKCFDLFASKGYASITMRQIAQGLGVSTGTLYHYFPSKEALFEQLVEEMAQQDILRVATELKNAQTLGDRIEVAFDFLAKNRDYFFKQTLVYTDFYQQQSREGIYSNDALKRVGERVRQAIAELLGIQDMDVANFVLSLIDGLILAQIYGGEAISLPTQAKLLAQMLAAYLEQKQS